MSCTATHAFRVHGSAPVASVKDLLQLAGTPQRCRLRSTTEVYAAAWVQNCYGIARVGTNRPKKNTAGDYCIRD